MASRFATVSKDETTNTKKETKFGLLVFTGQKKKFATKS